MSKGGTQRGSEGKAATGNDDAVRVVLVGRSDAERKLRRVPNVELVRAREPLMAIGEVASPIDPDSPGRTVVLVAPGAVEKQRTSAFAAGVRRLDASARVLSLDEPAAAGFDGSFSISDTEGMDLLTELLGRSPPPTSPTPEFPIALPTHTPDAAESVRTQAEPARSDDIVGSLLRGADAVECAMRGVRERLGVPNTAFVAAARIVEGVQSPTGGVAVQFGGRVLGYLVAPRADRAAVEAEAATLAPWIALAAQQDQLKRAAFTDELTGAWNRRYFTRFLGAAIEKARAARHSVAVLYFDLDNFKVYNDRYGHAAGDEILIETVKLLRSVIRPSDRVCRIGGDEFAVVFYDPQGPRDPGQGQAPSDIGPISRRFQQQICRHKFPKLGGEAPGTLTISGGMAAFPWDGADVTTLLDRADELSLQSKRQGKNVITLGQGAERVCRVDE